MTPNYSSQPSIDKSDWRLFVLFVSPQPFFGNSILSLLIYAEEHLFLTVTESTDSSIFDRAYLLADDYHPMVFQHQWFYERAWSPTVSIIPQANSNYVLCWDFGTETNARHLSFLIPNLCNLQRMYLFDAAAAALTYESQPNVDTKLWANRIADFERLPLAFGSRLKFNPARTCMANKVPLESIEIYEIYLCYLS